MNKLLFIFLLFASTATAQTKCDYYKQRLALSDSIIQYHIKTDSLNNKIIDYYSKEYRRKTKQVKVLKISNLIICIGFSAAIIYTSFIQ